MGISARATYFAPAALAALLCVPAFAQAADCRFLRYSFQPDCFRPSLTSPCDKRKTGDRLDLGPQIAVWLEKADGSGFIDTLMVTNQTAVRGIGNRPGRWDFLSSPKFPYGKRRMALPVWAFRRGKLYEAVVMKDFMESWLGWHESISSPDPFYCRPMKMDEIDVDAVSCPTAIFNSDKGRVDTSMPKSYYPPRNDLTTFSVKDCDTPPSTGSCPSGMTSAMKYSAMNDLDAVAAATPPYGAVYTGTWTIPAGLPSGSYAVMVEVNKEFDQNPSHKHPSFEDPMLKGYGLTTNFGQPSVVYRVPIKIDRYALESSTTPIEGYGDWTGATGDLSPRDATISTAPGSGEGRLLEIPAPLGPGSGRVHVAVHGCTGAPEPGPRDAGPDSESERIVPDAAIDAAQGTDGALRADASPDPPDSGPRGCGCTASSTGGPTFGLVCGAWALAGAACRRRPDVRGRRQK